MAALAAETLFTIGSFPVTNTIIHTLIVDGIIIGGVVALSKNIKTIPDRFQNIVESVCESFYSLTQSISKENARSIFPYFMAFFIFILISNWTALLPGVGSIGLLPAEKHTQTTQESSYVASETKHADTEHNPVVYGEKSADTAVPASYESETKAEKKPHLIPLLRGPATDINVTLALALVSAFATHMLAVRSVGWAEYLSRYFSLNPIFLFVGILELVSEVTKVISLSFRLFGNIYAGEVVLMTVSGLFAFLAPIPFLSLEVLVGFVQAMVFSMLTMAFMAILATPHHSEEH
jgi:F-type H+-transporting ATPase subunit a